MSLIDLDFDTRGVAIAISLEDGFRLLAPVTAPKEEPEEVEEAEEAAVEIDEEQEVEAGEEENDDDDADEE